MLLQNQLSNAKTCLDKNVEEPTAILAMYCNVSINHCDDSLGVVLHKSRHIVMC